ncbi:uncharacterized protein MONBRDRAFT_10709 [Monosiga brevicollis MX1]|uniref:TNFR-Cys domain-containing protein n=1 Tax=Monosiga brevicollis TaxID=81824 RepID=A9V704_MONBE|nr:uncharacterized protein MONBRDRAFT_10709 [Monosiga brevicollis MX1]EDQ86705.1 predicted protein [Monosiga brevicollis MX1]|eukprot:XP_001748541.1 hypothetical protein [Monosiga brevicollis MX1]
MPQWHLLASTWECAMSGALCALWRSSSCFHSPRLLATTPRVCFCETGQANCKRITVCQPGTRVRRNATNEQDRLCVACEAGTVSESTNAHQCDACPINRFQDMAGQAFCRNGTPCAPGSARSLPAHTTVDTVCQPCDGITTYADQAGLLACKNVTACEPQLEAELTPPSRFSDRHCGCILGTSYRPAAGAPCVATSPVCSVAAGEMSFLGPTLTSDRACVPKDSTGSLLLRAAADYDAVLLTDEDEEPRLELLVATLKKAIHAIAGIPSQLLLNIQLHRGSIIAAVEGSSAQGLLPLSARTDVQGGLNVTFEGHDLSFRAYGPCLTGTTSASGSYPGCLACGVAMQPNDEGTACVHASTQRPVTSGAMQPEGSEPQQNQSSTRHPTGLIVGLIVDGGTSPAYLNPLYDTSSLAYLDPERGYDRPDLESLYQDLEPLPNVDLNPERPDGLPLEHGSPERHWHSDKDNEARRMLQLNMEYIDVDGATSDV